MKTVLGISAFYHDSAAALVRGGEIVAAAQEERFSRKRHDPRFPRNAIDYCLEEAFIDPDEIDAVVFYDNPLLSWDRVLQSCMVAGASAEDLFVKAARSVLGAKLFVEEHVKRALGTLGREGKLLFTDHHMAHAASAFFPSPLDDAAILTLDGVGEWSTTSVGHGAGSRIELTREINYPHSLGLLYSAFTYYCGFKVNSGEYKLMGLAPYGTPKYADLIRKHLIDVRDDGSYRLDMSYFAYLDRPVMVGERFAELFGGPAREAESRITRREMDLAASIQAVTTEIVLKIARYARRESGSRNVVLAGGVALNCVANGALLRERIFDEVWIQPAAGDAGGALGAALLVAHGHYGEKRAARADGRDGQRGSYLGPEFPPEQVVAFLERHDYPYVRVTDPAERARRVAQAIADGKVVGHFAGRMEFGPRSLGARSILADARSPDAQSKVNLKIKYRESFRPFAPAVLREDVAKYFDLDADSPYMLIIAPVRSERCIPMPAALSEAEDMLAIVNAPRSDLPAITHVDYSARIQTVDAETLPEFHDVLAALKEIAGVSVVVNTSFNVRGEPIVCTPKDAYTCFMRTEMDLLALGDCLLWKAEQPAFEDEGDWKAEYGND
ncbi:MAG: carbamoyltransferase [Deltaproteobacteria bacterium]|nr:carbamoyltransferase [Deltaproteobacteria bacterium]